MTGGARRRRCNALRAATLLLAIAFQVSAARAGPDEFDRATGYKIARYRAPVPDEAPGAKRIFVEDLERLVRDRAAVLIDVAPTEGGVPDKTTGVWSGMTPHQNIPGSVWLPNVGKGDASGGEVAYFEANLARLTRRDFDRPIILYCQADCWMSWNAVKRAASLGYRSLYWFPEGTDGWRDWDKPFAPAVAAPSPSAP